MPGECRWTPLEQVPTVIISGSADRIVDQRLWDDPRYHGDHVAHRTIIAAARFPWIEQPRAVHSAFAELAGTMHADQAEPEPSPLPPVPSGHGRKG